MKYFCDRVLLCLNTIFYCGNRNLKLELNLISLIKLICQINISQLSSFFNDILEVFSTRGLLVFSRDLYAF
jgi:hypothetical protein